MKKSIIAVIAAGSMILSAPVYAASFNIGAGADISYGEEAIAADLSVTLDVDPSGQAFHMIIDADAMGETVAAEAYIQMEGTSATLYATEDGATWYKGNVADASQIAQISQISEITTTPLDLSGVLESAGSENGYNVYSYSAGIQDIAALAPYLSAVPQLGEYAEMLQDEQVQSLLSGLVINIKVLTSEADNTFGGFSIDLNGTDLTALGVNIGKAEISLNLTDAASTVTIPEDIIANAEDQGDVEIPSIM